MYTLYITLCENAQMIRGLSNDIGQYVVGIAGKPYNTH